MERWRHWDSQRHRCNQLHRGIHWYLSVCAQGDHLCAQELPEGLRAQFQDGRRNTSAIRPGGESRHRQELYLGVGVLAAKLGQTVVWHRRVRSGKKQIVTYVFHEKKVYQLKDLTGEMYNQLYAVFQGDTCGPTNCWFCLDGVNQEQVERMNWTSTYDMLATSGQFDVKSEMGSFSRVCVVPYWKQGDLEHLASKLNDPPQYDVDSRYYVSGGSLREFLNPYTKENAEAAILQISSAQIAETLLSKVGSNSDIQVDRLRTRGVHDINNVHHYMNPGHWTFTVSSKFVLNHIAQMMSPDFYKCLMSVASGMHDERLERVAFEGYFHSLVRRRQVIKLHLLEFPNKKLTNLSIEEKTPQSLGCLTWTQLPVVVTEGENMDEGVNVMTEWAKNPS